MIWVSAERDEQLERLERKIQRLNRLHSRLSFRANESQRISFDPDASPKLRTRLLVRTHRRHRRAEEAFQLSAALHRCWCDVHDGKAKVKP